LGGEPVAGLDGALGGDLAGSRQLACSPFGEPLGTHCSEHLMSGAELLAALKTTIFLPQPFAVDQEGAGEVHLDTRARKLERSA
jgi:hypothetical protein